MALSNWLGRYRLFSLGGSSKRSREETGIECEVVKPIAILDGMRLGFTGIPLYSLVFHCQMTGGTLKPHL